MKSLALTSKIKSLALASKSQVFENCPVLGSRTALFFEPLKFCSETPETSRKVCEDLFLFFSFGERLKKNFGDPFFWRTFAPVSLVLGLGLKHFFPWPREVLLSIGLSLALDFFVSLALSLVSSTPPLFLWVLFANVVEHASVPCRT